jgi:hypothetical protein
MLQRQNRTLHVWPVLQTDTAGIPCYGSEDSSRGFRGDFDLKMVAERTSEMSVSYPRIAVGYVVTLWQRNSDVLTLRNVT